ALKQLIKLEQKQLKSIKNTIQDLEKQMMEIVKSSQDLNTTYTKISSVIGVGTITSIKCIIETDNFTRFTDARKFNCHCGLAPFPYQSGSIVKGRTKTHFLRDYTLKSCNIIADGIAVQHTHK